MIADYFIFVDEKNQTWNVGSSQPAEQAAWQPASPAKQPATPVSQPASGWGTGRFLFILEAAFIGVLSLYMNIKEHAPFFIVRRVKIDGVALLYKVFRILTASRRCIGKSSKRIKLKQDHRF